MSEPCVFTRIDTEFEAKIGRRFRKCKPHESTSPRLCYFLEQQFLDYSPILANQEQERVRLTFERLDAFRISRGEALPDGVGDQSGWLYRSTSSAWLHERSSYELAHARLDLIEAGYAHYLLPFHDEYFEWISQGFWLEPAGESGDFRALDHPLRPLPVPAQPQSLTLAGRPLIRVLNPRPLDELIRRSALCTHKVLQYFFVEEGFEPYFYLGLRTMDGISRLSLQGDGFLPVLFGTVGTEYRFEEIDRYVEAYLQSAASRFRS